MFTLHNPENGPLYCNVIHFTQNANNANYGDKTPMLNMIGKPFAKMLFSSSINGLMPSFTYVGVPAVDNQKTKYVISQRYMSGGKYRYQIEIDDVKVYSEINSQAEQFYNVKVYASDPYHKNPCPGTIYDLEVTNFL